MRVWRKKIYERRKEHSLRGEREKKQITHILMFAAYEQYQYPTLLYILARNWVRPGLGSTSWRESGDSVISSEYILKRKKKFDITYVLPNVGVLKLNFYVSPQTKRYFNTRRWHLSRVPSGNMRANLLSQISQSIFIV